MVLLVAGGSVAGDRGGRVLVGTFPVAVVNTVTIAGIHHPSNATPDGTACAGLTTASDTRRRPSGRVPGLLVTSGTMYPSRRLFSYRFTEFLDPQAGVACAVVLSSVVGQQRDVAA
jgi:hypothetical protein